MPHNDDSPIRTESGNKYNFKLIRFFSLTSLIVLLIVAFLLGLLYFYMAQNHLIQLAENNNVALTKLFTNSIWDEFAPFLTAASNFSDDELRNNPEAIRLSQTTLSLMNGIKVVKVKIFDLNGRIIFSTQSNVIGHHKSGNPGFLSARSGQVKSALTHRNTIDTFEGEREDRDVLSSYIPIRPDSQTSSVEGVFEIYTDVTSLLQKIKRTQKKVVLGVIVILGLLYGVLHIVIRHADQVIRRQKADLQRVNRQLREEVVERQRAEEASRQAMQVSETAARLKGEFLAIMSHEIRTPMNGVIGMTGLLLDTELSVEQREYADTIRKSGEALLTIVNDILDFSKIEAGKFDLERVDFELPTAVEDVLDLLAERAYGKGLELAYWIQPDVPCWVTGDSGRLRQILTNLISNAIKFTDTGEIVIRVTLAEEIDHEALIRFAVTDTGIGIPAEKVGQLFESFSQVDGSITRKYGGTGLGLVISKRLAEAMGGTIGVESEVGVGSTFWFTVRLDKRPAPPTKVWDDPSRLHHIRVLGVDDNATNRTILERQLGSWGMQVDCVDNGPAALERLRAASREGRPYLLAIIDYQMPEMDGIELARAIKADPTLSMLRLVMLTSIAQRQDREGARHAGVAAYLTKPVRQSQLYDCLATVMNLAAEPTAAAPSTDPEAVAAPTMIPARILVAEDNAVNQRVAVRMLEKYGCRVDVVANGREAVDAVCRIDYDLVLMDCQMPEMNGFAATAAIRAREVEAGGHIPIVAMTANALEGDRERCLDAGMDDYVSKPVRREDLLEMLLKWTRRADAAGTQPELDSGSESPLDAATFAALQDLADDGDTTFVLDIIEQFVQDAMSQLDLLRVAAVEEDAAGLERAAHTLKSSSAQIGALGMAELCRELQERGRSGAMAGAAILVEQLTQEFARVQQALDAERSTLQESLSVS